MQGGQGGTARGREVGVRGVSSPITSLQPRWADQVLEEFLHLQVLPIPELTGPSGAGS